MLHRNRCHGMNQSSVTGREIRSPVVSVANSSALSKMPPPRSHIRGIVVKPKRWRVVALYPSTQPCHGELSHGPESKVEHPLLKSSPGRWFSRRALKVSLPPEESTPVPGALASARRAAKLFGSGCDVESMQALDVSRTLFRLSDDIDSSLVDQLPVCW